MNARSIKTLKTTLINGPAAITGTTAGEAETPRARMKYVIEMIAQSMIAKKTSSGVAKRRPDGRRFQALSRSRSSAARQRRDRARGSD